jgi:iron complex outermembrane receptor protein
MEKINGCLKVTSTLKNNKKRASMKLFHSIIILLITVIFQPHTIFATSETDAEKLEQVYSYFQSEYQEEDYWRTDELLLTATGSLKPLHLAPSVATVITSADIERIGATNLDQVLETVPGLHVEPSGSTQFHSIWSIRGIHTTINPHALLLINSIPLTSDYQGSRPLLFRMPVAMISRVEIVRGPGSALYGADAFSGTINIITKDNHEIDGTRIGARYGSFDTSNTWLQHGDQYGDFEIALGMEWQKTAGDKNRIVTRDFLYTIGAGALSNAPGSLDTSYEILNTHLKIRKKHWDFNMNSNFSESGNGPGVNQAISDRSDIDSTYFLTDLKGENDKLLENWTFMTRLYYSYIRGDADLQILPASYLNMRGNPIYTSSDGGIELGTLYQGFDQHSIRFRTGYKNYQFTADQYKNFGPAAGSDQFGKMVHVTNPNHIFMPNANRQLLYGLIQDEFQFVKKWELTAGVRYDEYSDFGSSINPRLALVWETHPELTTKVLYGQAFRVPSFAEQYIKNNPSVSGNSDLKPEEIETLEFVLDYQTAKTFHLVGSVFIYKAKQLIERTPGPLPQQFNNFGEQDGHGFELEMDWDVLDTLQVEANFSFQRSRYKQTDSLVPDAPGMHFYVSPTWEFIQDWSLNGQYYWVADRPRAVGDPREDIDDYQLVNLTLRRKNIFKIWEATMAISNLFDEIGRIPSSYAAGVPGGAYIPDDFPMEGRAIWVGLKVHI